MYNDYYIRVGQFFKNKRLSFNMTYENVGEALNKSKGWYYDVERGKNKIYLKDAKLLCDLFKCTLSELQEYVDTYPTK